MNSHKAEDNLAALKKGSGAGSVDILASARIDDKGLLIDESIRETASSLKYAVSIGIRLSAPVLDTVLTAPTWTYYYHYRTVNFALDQAALAISRQCQNMGYRAIPVPASQILDWDRLLGHLSHREVGGFAGIGWMGRNNLLVSAEYGSQVRYATILTDMPLPDQGAGIDAGSCGSCKRCIDVCPVGAIKEDPNDFDLDKCAAQLRRFSKSEKINSLICGLCLRVCGGTEK
ncbi:MAG: epoxyqueuosine reductase [Candidatus Krumholzibacteriota bacterium]|nr:epoxyqueuosine reductase [Candidatus Krumholzibacteriota bacterium]